MKFNWDKIVDRKDTHAKAIDLIPYENIKPEEGISKIPMWVADMNFETVPTIPEELKKRIDHPLYGYSTVPSEYFESIIKWQEKRNNIEDLKEENIGYENGVLGAISNAARVLAQKGDNILLHSPTYTGFTHTLLSNEYNLIHSKLYLDEQNIWRMDYEDMDQKIKENNIKLAIFCSPHNPTGRVWEKEEIEKAYEVFKENDVKVISDEIWSDIVLYENKHIPSQSISEDAKMRTIAFYAPSKTFNLAGLIGAYHIIYNKELKTKVDNMALSSHYNNQNIMATQALIGAYKEDGYIWVDELRQVLEKNIDYAYKFIIENWKGIEVSKPQGTYLMYLNLEEYLKENNTTLDQVLKLGVEKGVIWQDGRPFNFDNTIRLNLALPFELVKEAFERLDKFVFKKE